MTPSSLLRESKTDNQDNKSEDTQDISQQVKVNSPQRVSFELPAQIKEKLKPQETNEEQSDGQKAKMDEVVNAFKRRPSTHDLIKDPRYSMSVMVSPTIFDDDSSSDEEN